MNWLATFFARVFQILAPWLIQGLASLFQKAVQYFAKKKERKQRNKELQEALEREKNAQTIKEQEDAFKDVVDKSRGS